MTAMSQTGHIRLAGLNGIPFIDNTTERCNRGFAGTPSQLLVIPYMEGLLWVGSGAPTHAGTDRMDHALDYHNAIWYINASTGTTWTALAQS